MKAGGVNMKKYSTAQDCKDLSLTIYNGGFGAVKETLALNLMGNETEIVYSDVAQKIETDSLLVEGLNVLEFNYDYDLVGKEKLLTKYIDKEVFLKDRKTGEKRQCRLLSVEKADTCVLEDVETHEIYVDSQQELILPSLPAGLLLKPALLWKIEASTAKDINVSYLSNGFEWFANYVAELGDKTLNIAGWAEIKNQSGATFPDARIKLIAGDVSKSSRPATDEYMSVMSMYSRPMSQQAQEKTFFEYHMYTLTNPTTLKSNETKQINILNGENITYKKYYILDSYRQKARTIVEFDNKESNGLGIPLPKGKVKLYRVDEDDRSLEFIGEDSIDHTPTDETVTLELGNAFDIAFDTRETQRTEYDYKYYRYECTIRNHKHEDADIHFDYRIPDTGEFAAASHPFEQADHCLKFKLTIPADSQEMVWFEYRIKLTVEVKVKYAPDK
jgi:Uncharacterized conserved protein